MQRKTSRTVSTKSYNLTPKKKSIKKNGLYTNKLSLAVKVSDFRILPQHIRRKIHSFEEITYDLLESLSFHTDFSFDQNIDHMKKAIMYQESMIEALRKSSTNTEIRSVQQECKISPEQDFKEPMQSEFENGIRNQPDCIIKLNCFPQFKQEEDSYQILQYKESHDNNILCHFEEKLEVDQFFLVQ